jgi:probable HAF family extracellular repeat protein
MKLERLRTQTKQMKTMTLSPKLLAASAGALLLTSIPARATDPVVLDLWAWIDASSGATAINAKGQVAGWWQADGTVMEGFVYTPVRTYTLYQGLNSIGSLGGSVTWPTTINDRGEVAGYGKTASGEIHPFLWLPDASWGCAGMHDLGLPAGWSSASATAMNSSRQIVGYGKAGDNHYHAFIWQNGQFTDLHQSPGSASYPLGINDSGQVLIDVDHSSYFVWQNTGQKVNLTRLLGPGGCAADAAAINALGQVVGTTQNHPCVWDGATGDRIDPTGPAATALAGAKGMAISPSGGVAAILLVNDVIGDPIECERVLYWYPLNGRMRDFGATAKDYFYSWDHVSAHGQVHMNDWEVVLNTQRMYDHTTMLVDTKAYFGPSGTGLYQIGQSGSDFYEFDASLSGINQAGEACGTAKNKYDGRCHAIVLNPDQTPPQLSLVPEITAEATGPDGAIVTYDDLMGWALDNVDSYVPVTYTPESGSTFPLGTTTVTATASDVRGNTATDTFKVTVRDTTPPSITAPADVTAEATGASGAAVALVNPIVSDVVDTQPVVTSDAPAIFPPGSTAVTWMAKDASGNFATASQNVTVQDTTAPTIFGVSADIAAIATEAGGAFVSFTLPTATDLVDGAVPVTTDHAPGSLFPPGMTTVACSAVDAHGNRSTTSFSVTVRFSANSFLQPIDPANAKGVSASVFKAGSTVPVKFALTGASAGITTLAATFSYAKAGAGILGTDIEAVSTVAASSGNLFRYDPASGQYIFNWSTKGLSSGTYLLFIDLGDGVMPAVSVGLK